MGSESSGGGGNGKCTQSRRGRPQLAPRLMSAVQLRPGKAAAHALICHSIWPRTSPAGYSTVWMFT